MKKIFFILLALVPFVCFCQGKPSTSTVVVKDSTRKDTILPKKKNEFSASINYQSRLHYFGRTDSIQSSGTFPIITYTLKNGFYVEGTAVFVQNEINPFVYTGAAVEAGYNFPEKKHFEGSVYASKFFYQDKNVLVQSALQAQTGIKLTYKNKIINLNAGGDLKFSDKTDVGAMLGADHLFIKKINGWKKSAMAIMPSVIINAGTQNFTNVYADKENVLGIPVIRQRTEKIQQFNILDIEFSGAIVLVKGKFNAYIIPSYVIPQNLIAEAETGKSMFYVTAGFGIRL